MPEEPSEKRCPKCGTAIPDFLYDPEITFVCLECNFMILPGTLVSAPPQSPGASPPAAEPAPRPPADEKAALEPAPSAAQAIQPSVEEPVREEAKPLPDEERTVSPPEQPPVAPAPAIEQPSAAIEVIKPTSAEPVRAVPEESSDEDLTPLEEEMPPIAPAATIERPSAAMEVIKPTSAEPVRAVPEEISDEDLVPLEEEAQPIAPAATIERPSAAIEVIKPTSAEPVRAAVEELLDEDLVPLGQEAPLASPAPAIERPSPPAKTVQPAPPKAKAAKKPARKGTLAPFEVKATPKPAAPAPPVAEEREAARKEAAVAEPSKPTAPEKPEVEKVAVPAAESPAPAAVEAPAAPREAGEPEAVAVAPLPEEPPAPEAPAAKTAEQSRLLAASAPAPVSTPSNRGLQAVKPATPSRQPSKAQLPVVRPPASPASRHLPAVRAAARPAAEEPEAIPVAPLEDGLTEEELRSVQQPEGKLHALPSLAREAWPEESASGGGHWLLEDVAPVVAQPAPKKKEPIRFSDTIPAAVPVAPKDPNKALLSFALGLFRFHGWPCHELDGYRAFQIAFKDTQGKATEDYKVTVYAGNGVLSFETAIPPLPTLPQPYLREVLNAINGCPIGSIFLLRENWVVVRYRVLPRTQSQALFSQEELSEALRQITQDRRQALPILVRAMRMGYIDYDMLDRAFAPRKPEPGKMLLTPLQVRQLAESIGYRANLAGVTLSLSRPGDPAGTQAVQMGIIGGVLSGWLNLSPEYVARLVGEPMEQIRTVSVPGETPRLDLTGQQQDELLKKLNLINDMQDLLRLVWDRHYLLAMAIYPCRGRSLEADRFQVLAETIFRCQREGPPEPP